VKQLKTVECRDLEHWSSTSSPTYFLPHERVLISPWPDLLPDVVGRIDSVVGKGSVHVPNYKSFLVTETERKHDRRRARF